VHAARLEDVRVLNVQSGSEDSLELTLTVFNSPANSFFNVDIVKNDPEAFEKLGHIIKKMVKKNKYILDLEIPNFSVVPNGSYYKSIGVTFYGASEREPSAEKNKLKIKK